jgi:hypothetical protein
VQIHKRDASGVIFEVNNLNRHLLRKQIKIPGIPLVSCSYHSHSFQHPGELHDAIYKCVIKCQMLDPFHHLVNSIQPHQLLTLHYHFLQSLSFS